MVAEEARIFREHSALLSSHALLPWYWGPDPAKKGPDDAKRCEECHNADARFGSASTLTLPTGLQALGYTLWDSDLERPVPFRFAAGLAMATSRPR